MNKLSLSNTTMCCSALRINAEKWHVIFSIHISLTYMIIRRRGKGAVVPSMFTKGEHFWNDYYMYNMVLFLHVINKKSGDSM